MILYAVGFPVRVFHAPQRCVRAVNDIGFSQNTFDVNLYCRFRDFEVPVWSGPVRRARTLRPARAAYKKRGPKLPRLTNPIHSHQ
jgi:hypothetical protein